MFAVITGYPWPLPTGLDMHFCRNGQKEEKDTPRKVEWDREYT